MLGLAIALTVVTLARELAAYLDGDPYGVVSEDPGTAEVVGGLAQTLWSMLYLATGLTYAGWMYRASKNNLALGASGVRWGPGWAWGGWFIPFANYVIPYLVLRDIWKASDPGSPPGELWRQGAIWPGLPWWWALWIVNGIVAGVSFGVGFSAGLDSALSGSVPDLPVWLHLVEAVSLGILIATGFIAMQYTRLVEARQARRRGTVGAFVGQAGYVPPYESPRF